MCPDLCGAFEHIGFSTPMGVFILGLGHSLGLMPHLLSHLCSASVFVSSMGGCECEDNESSHLCFLCWGWIFPAASSVPFKVRISTQETLLKEEMLENTLFSEKMTVLLATLAEILAGRSFGDLPLKDPVRIPLPRGVLPTCYFTGIHVKSCALTRLKEIKCSDMPQKQLGWAITQPQINNTHIKSTPQKRRIFKRL